MGYCMNVIESLFTIKAENVPKAVKAIQALDSVGKGALRKGRSYSWVANGFSQYHDIADIMEEWRWVVLVEEESRDVVEIMFEGEKMGDDGILFDAIAPYVVPGSYIDMMGEDGEQWRWSFNGDTCAELYGKVNFVVHEEDKPAPAVEKIRRVNYCPGNATQYDCIIADMGEDGHLFTWLRNGNGGESFVVLPGSMVHYTYFQEKMQLDNEADAAALLVLLHEETGNPVALPEGFNEKGLWEDRRREVTLRLEE